LDEGKSADTQSRRLCIACKREFTGDETTCPDDGTPLTLLTTEPQVGSKIDSKYEVIAVIGGGAMGLVYKCRHTLMKRIVAVKMLHPNLAPDAATVQRFQKESEALSCLNHPNILTVFDFGLTEASQPYLVTDFLEGETLATILEHTEVLDYNRVVKIFVQVTSALAHAHKNGVIHRDIKPSNIMLTSFEDNPDFVKILDFGIAKVMSEDSEASSQLTKTGEVFGSPLYMSPEQCRGKKLDQRSDIYSLGCVLYRCLTGKPALYGQDLLECLYKHVNEPPLPFKDANPGVEVPEALEAIVMKCLLKDPEMRFQSMSDLRTALMEFSGASPEEIGLTSDSLRAPLPADTGTPAGASVADTLPPVESTTKNLKEDQLREGQLKGNQLDEQEKKEPADDSRTKKVIIGIAAVAVIAVAVPVAGQLFHPKESDDDTPVEVDPYVDHMQKGIEEYEGGNYFEAREQYFKALALARKNKLSKTKIADALHHLISASAESKEYEMANDYLGELASLAGVSNYNKTPETAEAAEAYFDKALLLIHDPRGDLRKAAAILQKARGFYEARDGFAGDTMRCLATMGQIKILENNFDDAKKYMNQALEIAKSDPTVSQLELALRMDQLGDAYILLSNKTRERNFFDQADQEYHEALKLREQTLNSKDHAALAQSYLRIGVVDYLKNQYDRSLENLNKSLEIRTKQGRPLAIAEVNRAIAYVYLAQKKPDEASKAFQNAIASAQKAGPDADKQIERWKMVFSKMGGVLK